MKPGKVLHPEIESAQTPWRANLYRIIFLADTPKGRAFDVFLIVAILVSVVAVMLESVPSFFKIYESQVLAMEWALTIGFSVEYILRLLSVRRPSVYAKSFFGIVDLVAILPTYLSLLIPGAHALLVIRSFRLLRMFRIFKLSSHLREADILYVALRASRPKITVFLVGVLAIVLTMGSVMYLIESGTNSGFSSLPMSVYWSIVTLTTVGYGDVAPITVLGRFFASMLMIMGYGILAVPTGIVSVELARAQQPATPRPTQSCSQCQTSGHESDARHCKHCGARLG